MLDDLKIIEFAIPTDDKIRIYPLADLHIGDEKTQLKEFYKFKEKILADKNAYVVLVGDLMNNALKNSISNVYNDVMRPSDQKKWLAIELEDLRDRIICAVMGNHCGRNVKEVDDDPMYDVMAKLDIEDRYRQIAAFVYLRVGNEYNGRPRPVPYTMLVQHGSRGGNTAMANHIKYTNNYEGIDLSIFGHSHGPEIKPTSKLVFDVRNRTVTQKNVLTVIASAWQTYGGYGMNKQLNPAPIAPQIIELTNKVKSLTVSSKII